jgi:TonB family protein
MKKYPSAITVNLKTLPAKRGVQQPKTTTKATETPKAKAKTEAPKSENRIAEVNKRKRATRKKTQPKPQPKTADKTSTQESTKIENEGLPEGVELGSEFGSARLDASGFDSPYFLNVVFSKIRRAWDNPYAGSDSIGCTIYFVINRLGKISDSAIERSSGLPAYDQAALRAVLGSKPPPLPNQFGSDELGIHLEFKFIPYQ